MPLDLADARIEGALGASFHTVSTIQNTQALNAAISTGPDCAADRQGRARRR
jgi:hypothetical protein